MDIKVILYIATSLDGYLAKPNDDLSFLSIVEQDGKDYGYSDFLKSVAGKNIFIDGGAEVGNELLKDSLVDEFIISIIPVLLVTGQNFLMTDDGKKN